MPDCELVIRPMTPADADTVSALTVASIRARLADCYAPDVVDGLADGNSPAAVLARQSKQTDYVGLIDGRVVGMIGLKRNEIGHLFVHPDHDRRGIGRSLVAFAMACFRQAGHREMIVMSSLNAVDFYARFGFVSERRGSFPLGNGCPLEYVFMRAPLAPRTESV
ncbi:MAG: hypothetical protein BIFFINMI_04151 [Phycisphaerae bacterium]|nr:hypothetical protein [Phycisphaerae bacterium]